MALSYSSLTGGGSGGNASNDFTINVGTTGYTLVPLSASFPIGSYVCTSTLADSTLDVYFIAEDGTNAGYANATTSTTTITASKSFNKVVVYGAANNDTLTFQFKYVFAPTQNSSTEFLGAPPRIISVSDSDLQNINDTTVITGANFATDVQVAFTGAGYSSTPAKSIVRSSSTSLIVTRPDNFPTTSAPYTITVTNPGIPSPISTNFNVLSNSVTAGNAPVWSTAASLTPFVKGAAYSQTIVATDSSDSGSSIVYSVVSGSLPTGISFNTATATFSGTPTTNTGMPYTYTVRATDSGGNYVDRAFTLTQVVPDAPVIGTATDIGTNRAYNDGAASVTFTPATTGAAATSYTVTAYLSGSATALTATGSSSPITVTGLASNTTYTFLVKANNASGSSFDSSQTSGILITTVPQAPTIGTASITNTTTASVTFTAGQTGGKSITSYVGASSPSISVSTSGASSPVSITGSYAAGQTYTFAVAAVNANGTSLYSGYSNGIIPLALPTVSGGTVTSDATYYYRTFTGSGTLSISNSSLNMDILTVGGGGGGAGASISYIPNNPNTGQPFTGYGVGGGGGGGGVDYRNSTFSPGNYTVTIGGGGAASTNGVSSSMHTITATGGNSGGGNSGGSQGTPTGRAGGSGAAGGSTNASGDFYITNVNAGGGGGGAGSNGGNGSASIGSMSTTAGTGGSSSTYISVAVGGGGNGGASSLGNTNGASASANTGNGGGGASSGSGTSGSWSGGSGGSGRVVVRYLKSAALS